VPWGITPWYTNLNDCNGLIGEAIKLSKSEPNEKFDVSVQVILPNEWDASVANHNIGITAGVETDTCNPVWGSVHCNKMDHIIVPSSHTKNCLENSAAISTPIHVVPEAYFSELSKDPDNIDLSLSTDFNFLTVGVLTGHTPETDRKNLFYLIKWFVEEFKNDQNVGLVIKTNRGRETSIDREITSQLLNKILIEVGHRGTPKIYLLHGNMSSQEMNSLYKHPQIKCLISATRGEGFGLPMLEASIAGLPVLATNWSAHTEFLNLGKWIKFEYDLVSIDSKRVDNNIFMQNACWAQPREASVKKSMRKFYRSNAIPTQWAADLSKTLKKTHSIKMIMKAYDKVIPETLE
jgi:glycosyltransferase involved in cell wall biosynthesis